MTGTGTSCEGVRERLGEWLAGALDDDEAARVERHVEACTACSDELAALGRVEERLWAFADPAPRPRRAARRPGLAFAAAAALALVATAALAVLALRSPPLPPGLLAGAVVEPEPDARLAILGPRRVRLDAGEALFHVQPAAGRDRFVVETPPGTFTVLGTSFRLSVKEEAVTYSSTSSSGRMHPAATGAAFAVVAVVSGVVGYVSNDGAVRGDVKAGERGVARAGSLEVAPVEASAAPGKPTLAEALAEVESLKKETESIAAERAELRRTKAEAETRLAAAEARAADAEKRAVAAAAALAPAPAETKKVPIAFGRHAKLPEIVNANWAEMGEAARNMNGLINDLMEPLRRGEQPPPEVGIQIAKENMKLQKFAFAANGKLPTHATGNGEYTHPLALSNIMAEHLKAVGRPLSDAQMSEIASIGEEYDLDWDRLQSTYTDETLKVEKVLDELELKHATMARIFASLSPDQRAIVVVPGVHDVVMLDLYSPLLICAGIAPAIPAPSPADLRMMVVDAAAAKFGVKEENRDRLGPLADRFVADVAARLEPVSAGDANWYTYEDAVAGGRATARFRKDLPRAIELTAEQKAQILGDPTFVVPRIVGVKK